MFTEEQNQDIAISSVYERKWLLYPGSNLQMLPGTSFLINL